MVLDTKRLQSAMRVKVSTSHLRAEPGKDRPEGTPCTGGVVRAATYTSVGVTWWVSRTKMEGEGPVCKSEPLQSTES